MEQRKVLQTAFSTERTKVPLREELRGHLKDCKKALVKEKRMEFSTAQPREFLKVDGMGARRARWWWS